MSTRFRPCPPGAPRPRRGSGRDRGGQGQCRFALPRRPPPAPPPLLSVASHDEDVAPLVSLGVEPDAYRVELSGRDPPRDRPSSGIGMPIRTPSRTSISLTMWPRSPLRRSSERGAGDPAGCVPAATPITTKSGRNHNGSTAGVGAVMTAWSAEPELESVLATATSGDVRTLRKLLPFLRAVVTHTGHARHEKDTKSGSRGVSRGYQRSRHRRRSEVLFGL